MRKEQLPIGTRYLLSIAFARISAGLNGISCNFYFLKNIIKNIPRIFDSRIIAYLAIFILLAAAFFLRVYKLGEQNYWIDEGFTIMQTRAIAAHGYPLLGSGNIEKKDILLPYFSAGIVKIFGESPFNYRIISVIFGTLAIYLAYLAGKNLHSAKFGLVFSFFMTFSYWHIAWSRQARGYSLLVFFILAIILSLIYYEKQEKNKYLFLSFGLAILAALAKSHGAVIFVPLAAYLFIKKKIFIGSVLVAGLVIFELLYTHLMLNAFKLNLVNYLSSYAVGYFWKYFGIFLALFIAGSYLAVKGKKYRDLHLFILSFFIIALATFSFFVYLNQKRYLFFITPLFYLYAAHFLFHLKKYAEKIPIFVFLLAVVIIDFASCQSLIFIPKEKFVLERYTPQPDFKSAYKYLKNNASQNDFIVSAYPYMDLIHLGKSDYAIPFSYSGRKEDVVAKEEKEYYSGVKKLYRPKKTDPVEELIKLQYRENVYVILDIMAFSRISDDLQDYLDSKNEFVFRSEDSREQQIYVYKMPKI